MSGTEERRRRMRGAVLLLYEHAAMVAVMVVSLVTNPIFVVARNVRKDMFGGVLGCVCLISVCVFVFQNKTTIITRLLEEHEAQKQL